MKANYRNLLALSPVVFFGTAVQAQLYTPNGQVLPANSNSYIGVGTVNPVGILDLRDIGNSSSEGTLHILNEQVTSTTGGGSPSQGGGGGGGPVGTQFEQPRNAILVKFKAEGSLSAPESVFSVNSIGSTQIGNFTVDPGTTLSVRNGMGVYRNGGNSDYIRLNYNGSGEREFTWRNSGTGNGNVYFRNENNATTPMVLSPVGKVGINTDYMPGNHSLYVRGSAIMEEAIIKEMGNWGDFVFEPEYPLMPLNELDNYLKQNKHLPDFPTAAEVKENGLAIGETQRLLTIKVEELTLYLLQMNEEMQALREEITTLRGEK